jgi:membrane-bound serine protease (ClpP class)
MSPTVSYFMLLGGMLVAYIEFLRPGLVVPGVLGGVAAIWGLSRLAADGLNWEPAAMFLIGALLLVVQAWFWKGKSYRTSWIGGIGALCMWWGSAHLVRMPLRIDPQAAELGVCLFAIITVPLLGAAFRAKRNKAVL